jgi:hypothetical protein
MANLYPRTTGLPRAVYVSPRNAPHVAVREWAQLNFDAHLQYCDGLIDTVELVGRLKKI